MAIYTETDTTVGTQGGFVGGTGGNDTYNLTSTDSLAQFHPWGGWGNDVFNLLFSGIAGNAVNDDGVFVGVAHGHHVYGDLYSKPTFSDTFNFKDIHEVTGDGVVVGRLNDFDSSGDEANGTLRDIIQIEGEDLDLTDLSAFNYSAVPSVASIRVVAYKGDHNDPGAQDQQWLLITTSTGGRIFYALEGARVDMNGDGDSGGTQEHHFVSLSSDPATRDVFFNNLQDIPYQPTDHYVPAGYTAEAGGVTYNDRDVDADDVYDVIGDESDEATAFGDLIAGGLNNDTIYGQGGNDLIWGGTGNDIVYGGTGNDTVRGGFGDDTLSGDAGNDWLIGGNGNDTLHGGAGVDNLRGEDGDDTLNGDGGDDNLRGGSGDDVLYGGDGNDTLYGGTDTDQLYGGDGNDVLRGENGHDLIEGGNGVDWLIGGNGSDTLYGGADRDYLRGEAGNDTLDGGDGDDDLRGSVGDDNLYGGAGDDTMWGGSDTDRLFGSVGNDVLYGENGHDTLYGENGTDILSGGNGGDTLRGGRGNDTMTGGSGNDVFVFDTDSGADTITDFSVVGADRLDFSNLNATITGMGNLDISYGTTDTVIVFSGGSVTLEDTTAILGSVDFIF